MMFKDFKKFSKKYIRGDNWHNIDFNRGSLGYGWIYYGLVCSVKPKDMLCVGSKWGYVPAVLAMACADMDNGHVDFVDASYGPKDGPKYWGGAGNWSRIKAKNYFTPWGKYITLKVMTTTEYAKKHPENFFDLVFLDGDHSLKGIKSDFFLFWNSLNKGGYMLFHDIYSRDENNNLYGSGFFWENMLSLFFDKIAIPGKQGLGILRKKGNLIEKLGVLFAGLI